ncbi:MAG: WbqC family protein [Thaumarchaeota archaeon]|nr:WbqC family protein [Nitrososphaerota archaeon]MBI3641319.1 WbqC family protein [Nitrososphaerota archaeon]
MILTAHQPVYLPWLGLFHKIALADKFVFFNEVQYLPKDWMNRNKIKTPAGEIWLTVPVLRKGYRDMNTSEIEINNDTDWKRKHLKSILINYKKAPYFGKYFNFLEETYSKDWRYLADLNEHMLKWFLEQLGIDIVFVKASDFKFQGAKSELVLDMCKQIGADLYIFGSLGKEYAKVEDFKKHGIQLIFQEYKHPVYPQMHDNFIPNLSVIDLLFNCGPNSLDIIMSNNITKDDLTP